MASELDGAVTQLEQNIRQVVLGRPEVVRYCLVALLAGEHVLLEDVPGVGKTLMGKTLARSLKGDFCRIQFTPDLLPSDIVGSSIFDSKSSQFRFVEGPIFANVVLADEINRTPPRTQSALLEAMSDGQVSVDGCTYKLPQPFIVIATQNPFEFEGTYLLPESQLDRFLLKIPVGYPTRDQERQILESHRQGEPVDQLEPVVSNEEVVNLQTRVRDVAVEDSLYDYILDLVTATRDADELRIGVSTRGALSLYRACQALAFVSGRDFVVPDDVKRLAVPVLAHRVVPQTSVHGHQRNVAAELISRILQLIQAPD